MLKDLLDFLKSRIFLINLLLMVLLFFAIIFAVRAYLDHYTLHGESITVPEVKGGDLKEAKKVLKKRGLNAILKDSVHQKGAEPGEVLEQDPEAGDKVKNGRNIYLTIRSKGQKMVSMPDLKDKSRRHAVSILETLGLKVKKFRFKNDICSNCVLQQRYQGEPIEAGERIPEGSKIVLVLGKGKGEEKTRVPELTGLTIEESKERLLDATLALGSVHYAEGCCQSKEDSMNAKVYKQIPPAYQGNSISKGGSVSVWVTPDRSKVDSAKTDTSSPELDTNDSFIP